MAKNNTRKAMRLPQHAATMHGLIKWHTHIFEKLGWMVLAKAKGYGYKVSDYKKGINHLIETIKHVKSEYENHNRKHDLNVLLMNTEALKDFVNKHL
jgi:archaellum component FlaC